MKVGIVGFGEIAVKHLEVLRALHIEVPSSCNRSEAGRRKAADAGIERTYADAVEMVEREKLDGVVVSVNPLMLSEVARTLLPLGVPLLLEKPPGTSAAETAKLAALARQHGTRVMVGLNRRFYSVYEEFLRRIGGRENVTAVGVEWSEDVARMVEAGHPAELIPVLVHANSLHGLDLLPFFAGKPHDRQVWGRNLGDDDEDPRWQMRSTGVGEWGAEQVFRSSWDVPGRWRLVVDAPDCRLVSAPLESGLVFARGRAPEELLPSEEDRAFKPGFFGQARRFVGLMTEEEEVEWPACSLQDAGLAMTMADDLTGACQVGQRAG